MFSVDFFLDCAFQTIALLALTKARGFPWERILGSCRSCELGEPLQRLSLRKVPLCCSKTLSLNPSAAAALLLQHVNCSSKQPTFTPSCLVAFSQSCRKRIGGRNTTIPSSTQWIDRQFVWRSIVSVTDTSVTHNQCAYWWTVAKSWKFPLETDAVAYIWEEIKAWQWCHIFCFFAHCFRQFRGLESQEMNFFLKIY